MVLHAKLFLASGSNLWERIVLWYQNSWIRDVIVYLSEEAFNVNFGVYENFTLGSGTAQTVKRVIIGLMLGAILSAIYMSYTKLVHGRLIRALLRRECYSPETAITLLEAGSFFDPSVRRELSRGGALTKLTKRVDAPVSDGISADEAAEQGSASEAVSPHTYGKKRDTYAKKAPAVDFSTARFYIPEDLKYRAEVRYDRKGAGLPQFLLTVGVSIIAAFLFCRTLPVIITAADWLISVLS